MSPTEAKDQLDSRRWWILGVVGLAQMMIALDNTVMNIALPSAQQALHFSAGDRQWIITAYTLAFGSLLLISGRLADRLGRKNVLVIGLIGFAIASAVGGASRNFMWLVTCRAVQGLFAAFLAPAALAVLTTTFSRGRERARAFGIFGAIAVGGATIGLLLGGVLTEYLSWRWTMYINIVAAIPAAGGAIALLPGRGPAASHARIDIPGTATVCGGLFAIVYGFANVPRDGWTSVITVGFLAVGAVLLIAFVTLQARVSNPLLPLRVLVDRTRGGGYLGILLATGAMLGVFLFLSLYLQQILGYSAVRTGLAFLPLPLVLVLVAAVLGPALVRRVSPKATVPVGMLLGAAGVFLLTRISLTSGYFPVLLPSMIVLGVGLGLVFSTSSSIATLGVLSEDAGVASATFNTVQQVGGSIGVAVLNTLAATATARFLIGRTSTTHNTALASVHGYVTAFWWSTGLFLVGALVTVLLLPASIPAGLRDPGEETRVVHT
ncbi:MFS transporter [Rugosimonospora acidiphila]|uniref:MFS transporter n=1 Tax=Rugosimonospora acidiphila TaxID=556531 RepID=A0ABP9RV41_9ACTN